MTSSLPPDPYLILGVTKDAQVNEIRSAHRKLVLKCHPDKVQDAELKAIKQDEFQRVQQAYELLSDDRRRQQYDNQVRLMELQKELGRSTAARKTTVVDYTVRTAEYRPPPASPAARAKPPAPRFEEERTYTIRTEKKPTTYEKDRRPNRDDERRRRDEREREKEKERDRLRELAEKEKEKERRKAKKNQDKERRREYQEKRSKLADPLDDEDSGDHASRRAERRSSPLPADKKSRRHDEDRKARDVDVTRPKYELHTEDAAQYIAKKRSRGSSKARPVMESFGVPSLRRAETYDVSTGYMSAHAPMGVAMQDDIDHVMRSAARASRPRSSEHVASRRDSSRSVREKSESYIVDPPMASSPTSRKPTLQTQSSAPLPTVPQAPPPLAREKTRTRKESVGPPPSLQRPNTFSGERSVKPSRAYAYISDESDEVYDKHARRHEEQVYNIIDSRAHPIKSHRSKMRDDAIYTRGRSTSPHEVAGSTRYVYPRGTYAEPVVVDARPPKSSRDPAGFTYSTAPAPSRVKYSTAYTSEDVSRSSYYRRDSEPAYSGEYSTAYTSPYKQTVY